MKRVLRLSWLLVSLLWPVGSLADCPSLPWDSSYQDAAAQDDRMQPFETGQPDEVALVLSYRDGNLVGECVYTFDHDGLFSIALVPAVQAEKNCTALIDWAKRHWGEPASVGLLGPLTVMLFDQGGSDDELSLFTGGPDSDETFCIANRNNPHRQ